MRRMWSLVAVLGLAGCAPGNPGLIVGGALAPDDMCAYEEANLRLLQGVLDVRSVRVSYFLTPVLFSQLLNLGGTGAPPRADPNPINVNRAEVELRDVNGAPFLFGGLPNPFTVPATGFVPSSDGMSAGVGIGNVELVPAAYGEALRDIEEGTIVAVVRFVGVTAGGADVVSNEFHWPIALCAGCLFACERNTEGEAQCRPSCSPGQDRVTVTPSACDEGALIFTSCVPSGT